MRENIQGYVYFYRVSWEGLENFGKSITNTKIFISHTVLKKRKSSILGEIADSGIHNERIKGKPGPFCIPRSAFKKKQTKNNNGCYQFIWKNY